MPKTSPRTSQSNAHPSVCIVVSRYNATVTDKLLDGARRAYAQVTGTEDVEVIDAPGSYELPVLALAAARTGRFEGVVALGCLIKGETSHDGYIAEAVAHGLMNVTMITGIPVAFGVVTTDTPDQANARAGGEHGNKGADAMSAVLETIGAIDSLNTGAQAPATAKAARAMRSSKPDKAAAGGRR